MNRRLRAALIVLLAVAVVAATMLAVYERPADEDGKSGMYGYHYQAAAAGGAAPQNTP